MAENHRVSYTVKYKDSDENSRTTARRQVEDYEETGQEHNYNWAIADGITNTRKYPTVAITRLNIVTFFMVADGDITVCINDASTGMPEATWVLSANRAVFWHENMLGAGKPFPQNIDASPTDPGGFYFTNASGATVNVNVICLES